LYKGSRDGFSASNFHSKCDNKGPTLTVVSVGEGYVSDFIFGGFNPGPWNSGGSHHSAPQSLLFSLRRKAAEKKPQLIKTTRSSASKHIYNDSRHGPTFGSGHDLHIASKCNTNTSSYSHPGSYNYGPVPEARINYCNYFAGSQNFKVCEIEIYQATRLVA